MSKRNVEWQMQKKHNVVKNRPKKGTSKLCPRCCAQNVSSHLELYQVTDTTAVFLCTRQQCLYQRELPRDYSGLQRVQDRSGEDHREKAAALKDWTCEGKRAVDAFTCPLSFKDGSPEEACTVLRQAMALLGVVTGEEVLPGAGMLPCSHQHQLARQCDEEELDPVDALLRDSAQLDAHKAACCVGDFAARVGQEFSQLDGDLRRLGVDASTCRRKVAGKYSTVDTAELFSKWLGDRFDLERDELPCRVVDLSDHASVPDVLDTWLTDAPCGEWNLDDSFTKMFHEGIEDAAVSPSSRSGYQ